MKNDNKKEMAQIKAGMGKNITVSTAVNYIPDQSDSKHHQFTWVYEISIRNEGDAIVQLLYRFWRIIDMNSRIEEIRGIGVIGLQPIIRPGKDFVYTSFCQLTTPQGTMEGLYEMQNLEEERFQVPIPKFILSAPSEMTKAFKSRLH